MKKNMKIWHIRVYTFSEGLQVILKLTNFKFFFIFWKYNSNPLTYIINLLKRQIQKKLCRPFKLSHFLGTFGQKWQKMRFSGIKMVKTIIFGLFHETTTMPDVEHIHLWIVRKNFFWSWETSSLLKSIYIRHIYCVFSEVAKTSKLSCPTSKNLTIFKNFAFALQHTFLNLRSDKITEIRPFEFECQELQIFVHENKLNYYTCEIYKLLFNFLMILKHYIF